MGPPAPALQRVVPQVPTGGTGRPGLAEALLPAALLAWVGFLLPPSGCDCRLPARPSFESEERPGPLSRAPCVPVSGSGEDGAKLGSLAGGWRGCR